MVQLTDLDGVGPARSESLEQAGYTSVQDVADADAEQLAEGAEIPEDTALGFVVQAENLTASEEAEVEEQKPVTQQIEDAELEEEDADVEEEDADVEEEDADVEEEETPERVEVEFEFESGLHHDVLFAATMRHLETMLQGNRTQTEVFDSILEQTRTASVEEGVTIDGLEPEDLNELHNSLRKIVTYYQGNNLIDRMNAAKNIQNQLNEYRQQYLF